MEFEKRQFNDSSFIEPSTRPQVHPLDSLLRLGNFFQLDLHVDPFAVNRSLEQFSDQWAQYNPYKPEVKRKGLSITSLDGKIGTGPDMHSLREYYRREGVLYKESDFNVLTPVVDACPEIHPVIKHFSPHLGRSHFLKFGEGGYFPPHRDGAGMEDPDCFRILVPLNKVGRSTFVFMHGGQQLPLEAGGVYFLNTLVAHSAFSFCDDTIIMVCNVILNRDSVAKVKSKLLEK